MNSGNRLSTPAPVPAEVDVRVFEVDDDQRLGVAGFKEILKRSDIYCLPDINGLRIDWAASADQLAKAMDECPPLTWKVHRIYCAYRDDLVKELANAKNRDQPNAAKISRLKAKLDAMPEDAEFGVAQWLQGIDRKFFKTKIVKSISEWFDKNPASDTDDYDDYEVGYIPNAQFDAVAYFDDLGSEMLELLGVAIYEVDWEGGSFRFAELRRPIEEANAAAIAAGLPERFVALAVDDEQGSLEGQQ